ncbi:MAG TPA: acylphosphatase [Candidatus Limnocylindrales bacterium]|nr:acylphosphatase [Candidatus Limnocylindrales bacterium]
MGTARGPAPARRRLDAVVRGSVQGVGYRFFVVRAAMELGLTGWVANLPDGAVRCVAEGEDTALEAFVERLRAGPAAADVEAVLTGWPPATGEFTSFSIRSGWHAGD